MLINTNFVGMKKLIPLLLVLLSACSQPAVTLFVGTYSDGFYAFDFNLKKGCVIPADGEFGSVAKAPMPNPSFLAIRGSKVYAVSEMPDTSAAVYAWRYGGNGFELLGSQPTGLPENGEDPCYVATDGRLLAVANYSGGTLAVYKLREDGVIAPLDSLVYSSTGGPDLSRQESPHRITNCCSPNSAPMPSARWMSHLLGWKTTDRRCSYPPISARGTCCWAATRFIV